jgi:hypothetical protein
MADLRLGGRVSHAFGINNEGRVVEGALLIRAVDINNAGQVLAIAQVIPEPEAYAMLLAGLGLIGFMVWRERLVAEKPPVVSEILCGKGRVKKSIESV